MIAVHCAWRAFPAVGDGGVTDDHHSGPRWYYRRLETEEPAGRCELCESAKHWPAFDTRRSYRARTQNAGRHQVRASTGVSWSITWPEAGKRL